MRATLAMVGSVLAVLSACGGKTIDGSRPSHGAPRVDGGGPVEDAPAPDGAFVFTQIEMFQKFCELFIDCQATPPVMIDVGWCVDNIRNNLENVRKLGCADPFDGVMQCISRYGTCDNPNAVGHCEAAVASLTNCLGRADAGNPFPSRQ